MSFFNIVTHLTAISLMRGMGEKENLGGLILVLKFSYSGSKYGQQTFAIHSKPFVDQIDVAFSELQRDQASLVCDKIHQR